ncbi:MAG TPA: hydantoinase B/oxoprolinase family protein [Ktedonobacterales bacterium]|nr:hydantoinase B/oxoprolinase family protein [Ktedonobacterales bacterium]
MSDLLDQAAAASGTALAVDPIIVQIVEGTLGSVEAEVEAAIERTSRSPMIRDQHDYRAGIHDRHCRKLTGRSYSAMVNPVVRDFPLETMQPGDVYFHNDVYLSEGSVGHLPDLTVTVPVFFQSEVVAFVQAFGHHDDIGGMVPGSMPAHATSIFQEGLMVPPIRLYKAGVLNEDAYKIIFRNTRIPDSLAGDIDGEVAACQMGAERIADLFSRYGRETVEACFETIIRRCADTFRSEILPKIPDGTYTWEDYIEHDGVEPPRLHTIRLTMTKTPEKIILDFNGTSPQTVGPINWPGNYAEGRFLKKWVAAVLRNLADSPERAAELDINEGICDVLEVVFPPEGTLMTPRFPAPTNARSFTILRLLGIFAGALTIATGGRMPADQETIRYWGVHGVDENGKFYLLREVLGGGSGGRFYADGSDVIHIVPDSKNLPAEFCETRFPILIEKLALATDSGGPGKRRGGLGYEKDVRLLNDSKLISTADRTILSCYGVAGGMAGGTYKTIINPATAEEHKLPGLVDDEPLRKGNLIRLITTGGGGWGDPLEREPELVRLDVLRGLVSLQSAEQDYGVRLGSAAEGYPLLAEETTARREQLRRERSPRPFIDRGPGYEVLREQQ